MRSPASHARSFLVLSLGPIALATTCVCGGLRTADAAEAWVQRPLFEATAAPVVDHRPAIVGGNHDSPSSDAFWREALVVPSMIPMRDQGGPRPSRFEAFGVDLAPLRARLAAAPAENSRRNLDPEAGVDIALPLPDGRLERFRVIESSIFGSDLQRTHPELRTYRAIGVDDPFLAARLDLTAFGVRAIVFTREGVALIDPLDPARTDRVMSYWARDDDSFAPFDCQVLEVPSTSVSTPRSALHAAGDQLHTFRFILMATGEYAQTLGGVPQALAQMTTAMNRVNAIYERDAAVHFEVVHMMAFDDPATDPYPINSAGQLANRNHVVVDSLFGQSSYDMAQAISVTAGYAGQSERPFLCDTTFKQNSGVTGPDPMANQFIAHVMPHEIGHLVGATHTQDRSCNRSLTPYEPLSGLTIMSSVGGACPPDIQPYADPYLHVASIEQIDTVLTHPPGGCGTFSPSGNAPPIADAGADYTIPRGTPFVLTGGASDPDAQDVLTYSWEEHDMSATTNDPVNGPLFRWRAPTTTPSRLLPALATVLAGTVDPLEKLPTVDRLLKFRLTVRDNHAGTGGHSWDEMTITVSGAPFAVTSPNGGNSFSSGVPFNVTWTVGGGSVAANVAIALSTDSGASWSTLVSSTPNDGSESVTVLTNVTRTTCRIRVESVGNIFYDVSDGDFTIIGDPTLAVHTPETAGALAITALAPNPTGGAVRIEYSIPRAGHTRVSVLDLQGRTAAILIDADQTAGRHRAAWAEEGIRGRAPGLYFLRVDSGGKNVVRRIAVER